MAAAKAAPSSAVVAADAQGLPRGAAPDAPANDERPEQELRGEQRDTRAGEKEADKRDEGWPGPIDEPPPLFSS